MDYREDNRQAIAHFFEQWNYYKTVNCLHDRPASERFQAFKAAWTWHDAESRSEMPYSEVIGGDPEEAPPEYDMLNDWLAATASGFWSPVSE